jgi:excisionase family DNA binding protein
MEEWLTTFEAARISGYHPEYIRQLIREKKIQGRKWGLSWQVSRPSLMEYVGKLEAVGDRRGPKPKSDSNSK